MARRIGPKMMLAAKIVSENPGCNMYFVAKLLHPACMSGKNNKLGYEPVHRAVRAGVIRRTEGGKLYTDFV